MDKLLVVDVVGLTPDLLQHMPRLRQLAAAGSSAVLEPVLPAVTCSVQSTFLTGLSPTEHGIVGNGWYFRDLGEVHLWRQHNALVQGEKVWETIRRAAPRLHRRQRVLVVRHGCLHRLDGHPPTHLLRRREEGAGLLHPAARAPRRAGRRAGGVPAVPVLGPHSVDPLLGVDRRQRPAC